VNPLLFPPTLVKRALDDLSAIADAARRLTSLESGVLGGLSRLEAQIADLRREIAPIGELGAVRAAVEPLRGQLDALHEEISALRGEVRPIRKIEDVHAAVEPLRGQLDGLHGEIAALREEAKPIAEISRVREGIEPLDEDMRAVRLSVDDLEPLLREVNDRLEKLDGHIETLREDLSPLGELADKVPGVGRR
jgi:chromosome segregation ATPase